MLEHLLEPDGTPYLLDSIVNDNIIFNNDNYKLKFLELESAEFKGSVTFDHTHLKCGIHFRNCIFHGNLKFEGAIIDDYDTTIQHLSESLIFEGCKFYGEVIFSHNTSILRNLILKKKCEFSYALKVYYTNITEGSLYIEDCFFKNIIDIHRSSFSSQLSISGTKVDSTVRIVTVNSNSISFTGANDFQRGRVELCQVQNGIIFNDGIFNADWEINSCGTRSHGITLFSSNFKNSLVINYQLSRVLPFKISSFYIRECIFGNGMYVYGRNEDLTPEKTIIDLIDLKISTSMKGEINFQDLDVGNIKLSGVNTGCNIVLRNIDVNQFEIDSLTNSSGLILSNIRASKADWLDEKDNSKKVISLFKIKESNLNKAHLNNFDFSGFKDINVSGSLISEISLSLIDWFKMDMLNKSILDEKEKVYKKSLEGNDEGLIYQRRNHFQKILENKKDILRQIKIIYQKQSDSPKALYFQRHEMSLHKDILDLEKDVNIGDWLIFWTNKYSNDFGQNWIRAVIGLLSISFLCYVPIAIMTSQKLDQSQVMNSCSDLIANVVAVFDFNQLKQWFVLLNPAHRIVDLFDNTSKNISTTIYIIDFLSRIIVAYFVFQLISAFRKYNK